MDIAKRFFCRLADLIDVKSIVTFLLIGTLCYLAIRQNTEIPSELLAAVVSSIVTYFFTKKSNTEAGNSETNAPTSGATQQSDVTDN